jgi:hypothetical protein
LQPLTLTGGMFKNLGRRLILLFILIQFPDIEEKYS